MPALFGVDATIIHILKEDKMTTEEIEKAASEYADFTKTACLADGIEFTSDDYVFTKADFRNGAEFADKHWQEKTRWIPVEERLPVFGGERRTILVKTGENLYAFLWIIQELSLSDFECQQYTHWKEIE